MHARCFDCAFTAVNIVPPFQCDDLMAVARHSKILGSNVQLWILIKMLHYHVLSVLER